MGRTVICLDGLTEADGSTRITLRVAEPRTAPDAGKNHALGCDIAAPPFTVLADIPAGNQHLNGPLVKEVGEAVHHGLANHPGILHAINEAVAANPQGEWPIYIETTAPIAESFPVEVIYHPQEKFLCLDARWPIARMTRGGTESLALFLDPPLRIAAVLAAHDRPAMPEWEALKDAVESSGIVCRCLVLVAEEALKDHIEQQNLPWAQVEWVPGDSDDLMQEVVAFKPHLVHMFCHGSGHGGYLEIAHRNNLQMGKEPVFLSAQNLRPLATISWLLTLSACEGATPSKDIHSIAFSIVDRGLPAAIGMREAISSASAHKFAGSFYSELFDFLVANAQPGKFIEMRWAHLMRAPRVSLCPQQPAQVCAGEYKDWTLPVLYRRRGDLRIACVDPNTALDDTKKEELGALVTLLDQRASVHPGSPPAFTNALDQAITDLKNHLGLTSA